MRELVELAAFERFLWLLAALLCFAGLVGAAALRRHPQSLARGLALASCGPLLALLWLFYRWMVRYDPAQDYVGLHRIGALAISLVTFTAVGAIAGLVVARVLRARKL